MSRNRQEKRKAAREESDQPEVSSDLSLTLAKYLIAVTMCTVAISQMFQVYALGLTTWKGGGFGLFASLDHMRFCKIDLKSSQWRQPLGKSKQVKLPLENFTALPLESFGNKFAGSVLRTLVKDSPQLLNEPNLWVVVEAYDVDYTISYDGPSFLSCKPIGTGDSRKERR